MNSLKYWLIIIFALSIQSNFKNASAQWIQTGDLNDIGLYPFISVVDSNTVWIAGGDISAVVYRTTNGGLNWISVPTSGLQFALSGISAKDASTAFVCDYAGNEAGGNAKVFKTTNAGMNWILIDSTGGTNGFFNGIEFSKTQSQFGVTFSDPPAGQGNSYFLLKTTNGGNNWSRSSAPGIPNTVGLFFTLFVIDPLMYGFQTINLTTFQTKSYITKDGGTSWINGNQNITYAEGVDLVFSDNKQTGLITNYNISHEIFRTTNGGVNWNSGSTGLNLSGFSGACWISGTNTVFVFSNASTSGNNIIRSDDGGFSWTAQSTSGTLGLREMDYARYDNTIVAYCVSSKGNILKSRQSVQTTGVLQSGNNTPGDFELHQNYPNPFNPNTKIRFSIAAETNYGTQKVKLIVYDLLGKEIVKLADNKLSAGTYEVEFDGGNLPSGIYYYRLSAENHVEAKSMILIK